MKESEFENLIELFFSGKINDKLDYLKEKYKKPFDDDDYCTLGSPILDRVGKNLTNKISDPTGGKATRLADIKLSQRRNYEYYLKFYQTMNDYIKKLERFLVDNMKIYLGLIDSPLFEDEETAIKKEFDKIKKLFFKADILEKEKKTDPYKDFLEEQQPEVESNLAADRYSLEEAQQLLMVKSKVVAKTKSDTKKRKVKWWIE
jgi:hypothetical protein